MDAIDHIVEETERRIAAAADRGTLEQLRIDCLGKKGQLTEQLKQLKDLAPEERPLHGQRVNQAKKTLATAFSARFSALSRAEIQERLAQESVDISLPGRASALG